VPVEAPVLVAVDVLALPPVPVAPVLALPPVPVAPVLVDAEPPLPELVLVLEVDSEEPQAKSATAEVATKRT